MPTRVEVGSRGPLDGQVYLVLAKLVFKRDAQVWEEYLLAHGRQRRWLTIEDGNAYLWREIAVTNFAKPESVQLGETLLVEKLAYRVGERGTKTLADVDGTPEDTLENGEIAHYAEGRNDAFRVSIERWGASATEVYVGVPHKASALDTWSKAPPRPPRRPPPRVVTAATEMSPLASFAIMSLFVGFIMFVEGCWHDDECRFYRQDGTSYTARCSHYDANSVRSESTGRRLSGFGK